MKRSVLLWRRLDVEGLERLELVEDADGVTAIGNVLSLENGGLRLEHRWRLDPAWHAQEVRIELWDAHGHGGLRLERDGQGWRVNGVPRADLDGAEEPDLSVTPFCNTLPIRHTGAARTLDTAFIDGAALTVTRSRQQYVRLDARRLRYTDLGVARGFTAELEVDDAGLVLRYEHLFERTGGGP